MLEKTWRARCADTRPRTPRRLGGTSAEIDLCGSRGPVTSCSLYSWTRIRSRARSPGGDRGSGHAPTAGRVCDCCWSSAAARNCPVDRAAVLRKNPVHRPPRSRWVRTEERGDEAMVTLASIVLRLLEDALRWLMLLTRSDESVRAENLMLRRHLAMFIERGIRPRRVDSASWASWASWASLAVLTQRFGWRSVSD